MNSIANYIQAHVKENTENKCFILYTKEGKLFETYTVTDTHTVTKTIYFEIISVNQKNNCASFKPLACANNVTVFIDLDCLAGFQMIYKPDIANSKAESAHHNTPHCYDNGRNANKFNHNSHRPHKTENHNTNSDNYAHYHGPKVNTSPYYPSTKAIRARWDKRHTKVKRTFSIKTIQSIDILRE